MDVWYVDHLSFWLDLRFTGSFGMDRTELNRRVAEDAIRPYDE